MFSIHVDGITTQNDIFANEFMYSIQSKSIYITYNIQKLENNIKQYNSQILESSHTSLNNKWK